MPRKRENLVGNKYGLLTVVSYSHSDDRGHSYWNCVCDCGNIKTVRGAHLKVGNVHCCGSKIHGNYRHGLTHTRIYNIWVGMIARCENKNHASYHRYGGRNIRVCDKWKDFVVFAEWAFQNGYSDELTIDRIDNDGDYTPDNCRWATRLTQANNTRKNRNITINGETMSVSAWGRKLGINQSTLNMRLNKYHWSPEKALLTEVKKRES